jgi:serine acetyltransferase
MSMIGDARDEIRAWVASTLANALPTRLHSENPMAFVEGITDLIWGDLQKCTSEDEAAKLRGEIYLFETSNCARALATYRLSHALVDQASQASHEDRDRLVTTAMELSKAATAKTGIEIHPEAVIGARLRIDHGNGVVVGQQVRMGSDCTMLQEVVLGAARMDATDGGETRRRHPIIGNNVKIYGRVSVLGPVVIHDDAILGAGCIIRCDVPSGRTVTLMNQLQATSGEGGPELHHLHWAGENRLDITGEGLANATLKFVDSEHTELPDINTEIVLQDNETVLLAATVREPGVEMPEPPRLQLIDDEGEVVVIEAKALYLLWKNCNEISRPPAAAV